MNRPKLSLRRPLAILGAAFIGLAGAVAMSAPASAHHTTITASSDCDKLTGERVITWKVVNSEGDKATTVTEVVAEPSTAVIRVIEGSKEPVALKNSVIAAGGTAFATQRVPADTAQVKLTVSAEWVNLEKKTNDGTYDVPKDEPCGPPAPKCVDAEKAEYSHTFDGPKGTATVELKGDLPLCKDEKQWFTLVSYFAPRPQFATPQYVHGTPDSNFISNEQKKIDLKVEVPECNTQVDLIWGGKDEVIDPLTENGKRYGNLKLGSPGTPGSRSKGKPGWYNGGSKDCVTPDADFVSSCDGSVAVMLSNNGKISKYPVEFEVKGENGWSKKVTVAPGEANNDTIVPAANAGKIEVVVDGKVVKEGSWKRPENCPLPTITTKADCNNFTLTATNPAGGLPAKVEFSYDGKTETRTVQPDSSESVTFKAGKAKAATVTLPDLDLEMEIVYAPTTDCGGGGGGGDEPGLPVTGAAAGGIAAGAAVLLAIGVTLFVLARRRRVTFSA